jgi:predicted NodU family carbamoyl transferase
MIPVIGEFAIVNDCVAAAIVVDGAPVCAIQEERLSRHKGDAAFPLLAIESCLQHAGIETDERAREIEELEAELKRLYLFETH